ncbi:type II toxin-antitoxin system RelB/DinJ family antitoxin [Leclercia adecarboxylata]|uniref:Type II toxin-antitoxin system RelB/DinJ family antitoxin n=1 Tax=Leclercia adecarboxylata TaxID=83655 RepID=A0A9X3YE76_9ENTR|nr:type II toxin-antitoxin system RelB/DinJ family antitoxin [Leclercia adecarboxylata]MDC6624974.1 type II toxin-antitoxin system RelB/DinJ family antitoxin [Leclercia adecarboxylata]MDC6640621.1 type II toxin-antitoxin system RelB/DinJ family antitoxin [Leclercia adecarboxylata]MDC6683639.1 type II toxin-antitoxin system RelB/DinJ family antitoxin [Leclercia adecarboxylata]MDC6689003.1 type II toxin-antitoxin system RelB/DinJ family antitoxin [Leclercia adecarboxylata]MDC6725046.1 type II to
MVKNNTHTSKRAYKMAAINIKIDDVLKDGGDDVLREHGLNTTQAITLFWQYLVQHRRLPFIAETRLFTATDLTLAVATQYGDALNQLHKIQDMLSSGATVFAELAAAKLELSRQAAAIQQNGWRLASLPEDNDLSASARRMLPRIHYHLTGCDFALSDLPSCSPIPVRLVNGFGAALQQYESEFSRLQAVLRDSGLLARPEPLREFVYRDENVMISVIQQHDYQHGAWIVRMQAKSLEHENALEDAGLTFPELEGRVFLPGSVYGKAVRNSQTGKYEMGFRFLSGVTEFHMYSSGHEEDGNPTSADQVAASLAVTVDTYLVTLLHEMAGKN